MSKKAFFKWVVLPDRLLASFSNAGFVADDEWDQFVRTLRGERIATWLAAAEGVIEIDSVKRQQGAIALKEGQVRVACVTDEKLVRGVVTAVSWFGANVKAFSWAQLEAAAQYLEAPHTAQQRLVAEIMKLKAAAR